MTNPASVTIKDVAKLAGVSISTASRALTGAGGVRPVLESRVQEAAVKLNYRPNAAARGLRKARTATMGILFNNLRGPGQLDLLKGIGNVCDAAGFGLLAADANGDHERYLAQIRRFYEQRVEGLFLVSPIDLRDTLSDYTRSCVPVIAIWRKDASAGQAPLVAASERHGIGEAADDLRRMGHTSAGYFLRFWDDRREAEVIRAIGAAGLRAAPCSMLFSAEETADDAAVARTIRGALTAKGRPTALIISSTYLGPALAAVHDLGLQVPRDLSLVAIGSTTWHESLVPGIAAVEEDSEKLGQMACQVMLDWIGGLQPNPTYSELSRWVPRESIGPPPDLPIP